MDGERLIIEQKVLQHHLPQNAFKFVDAVGENPHVLIAAKTNSSKVYTLRIDLNELIKCICNIIQKGLNSENK